MHTTAQALKLLLSKNTLKGHTVGLDDILLHYNEHGQFVVPGVTRYVSYLSGYQRPFG